jgi:hypothetical protein
MDTVRTAVRGIPTQLSIPILRSVLKAPAPLARIMMNELTEPLNRHLPYIRKVYNGSWVCNSSCSHFIYNLYFTELYR